MQAALSFVPASLTLVAPTKNLPSRLRPISFPQTFLLKPIRATSAANGTSAIDYNSMANSVFPAEACETIGGEACDVEMYPEVKLTAELTNKEPEAAPERVEREYLEYNSPKTVFLEEACDDLGGEFCEPDYQRGD